MRKNLLLRVVIIPAIVFSIPLCSSCSISISDSVDQLKNTKYELKGSAHFPEYKFKILANNVYNVTTNATITLINSTSNKTEATGLTDVNGTFLINTNSNFIPEQNNIYILEARKRIGNSGSFIMSERTYVRWNGELWESITKPSLDINLKTTAMTLIQRLNNNSITADSLIKTLDISNGIGESSNTSINQELLIKVSLLVEKIISTGNDPVSLIKNLGSFYFIDKSHEISTLLETNSCDSCDFRGADLSNIDMSNKILTKSLFIGMNLSNLSFLNSDLTEVKFASTNIEKLDLSTVISLQGADFSDAYMSEINLTGRNLSNSNFTYAYIPKALLDNTNLTNANFTKASLTDVNLSNANLSNSDLTDTNFIRVNLTGANLTGANLKNTRFDNCIGVKNNV